MHKNTLAKFTLTALAAFAISACGSSGGGDGDNGAAPANEQAQNQAQQPATPAQPTAPVQPAQPETSNTTQASQTDASKIDSNTVGFSIPKSAGNLNKLSFTTPVSDVNIVNVEGKTIQVVPTGISGRTVSLKEAGQYTRYVGGRNQNIRWGLVNDKDLQNRYLLAYGVNPTTNMPTSGSATYVGDGFQAYSTQGNSIDALTPTNASLQVNFADKSLTGTITPEDNSKNIELSAKIDGNKFSGTSSSGTQTEGGFYGNDAQELTGSYFNKKEAFVGVYGATKQ